jgi:hypothetical protein
MATRSRRLSPAYGAGKLLSRGRVLDCAPEMIFSRTMFRWMEALALIRVCTLRPVIFAKKAAVSLKSERGTYAVSVAGQCLARLRRPTLVCQQGSKIRDRERAVLLESLVSANGIK